jgi:hypothetical protein
MVVAQVAQQHLLPGEMAVLEAVAVAQLHRVAALVVQEQQIKALMVQQIPLEVSVVLVVALVLPHLLQPPALALLLQLLAHR